MLRQRQPCAERDTRGTLGGRAATLAHLHARTDTDVNAAVTSGWPLLEAGWQ